MKRLLWVLLCVLAFSLVSAQDTSIEISLTPSGIANEEVLLTIIPEKDISNISYILDEKPYSVKVISNEKEIPHLLLSEPYEIQIQKQIRTGASEKIILNFQLKDSVEQIKKQYIYHGIFFNPFPGNSLNIELSLPSGYVVSEESYAVSPKPSKMMTDGKTITLVWNYAAPTQEIPIILLYERGVLEEQSGIPLLILAIIIVVILGVSIFFYFKMQKETKNTLFHALSPDEQAVVKLIGSNQGILQKDAVKQLNYSKHKMSKLVARLEEKGIINKTPYFKTNKLFLKIRIK